MAHGYHGVSTTRRFVDPFERSKVCESMLWGGKTKQKDR